MGAAGGTSQGGFSRPPADSPSAPALPIRPANTAPSSAPVCALGHLPPRGKAREECGRRNAPAPSFTRPDCDSNTENRRTVSRILAGIMQHAPGSRSNILPGSAPALRTISLYPFTPLPLPSHTPSPSPRALARNPGAHPGASTFASYSGANTAVSHTFCGETDGARWSRIPASETRSRGP